MPEIFNLAWAPVADVEEVDIYDRHNGVPTLGVFSVGKDAHLFWRVVGYAGDISFWLYVPLAPAELQVLEEDEGPSLLDGIVYKLPAPRYATIGIADKNRLIFEREWQIPARMEQDHTLGAFLGFVVEALKTATLVDGLPPTRRQAVDRAREVAKHLVPC
jgi:hypothetical protein